MCRKPMVSSRQRRRDGRRQRRRPPCCVVGFRSDVGRGWRQGSAEGAPSAASSSQRDDSAAALGRHSAADCAALERCSHSAAVSSDHRRRISFLMLLHPRRRAVEGVHELGVERDELLDHLQRDTHGGVGGVTDPDSDPDVSGSRLSVMSFSITYVSITDTKDGGARGFVSVSRNISDLVQSSQGWNPHLGIGLQVGPQRLRAANQQKQPQSWHKNLFTQALVRRCKPKPQLCGGPTRRAPPSPQSVWLLAVLSPTLQCACSCALSCASVLL